jgi:hypothetical protein
MSHLSLDSGRDLRSLFLQRRNKVKKVEQTKFLGVAPRSTKECHLALPCNTAAEDFIDLNDPATNEILAQIKSKYNVWVKINRGDQFVTLSGENLKNLNLAKDALRVFLVGIHQEVKNRMIILIHHYIGKATVQIKPISNNNSAFRPVALAKPMEEEDLIYFSDEEITQHGLDGQGSESALNTNTAVDDRVLEGQFSRAVQEIGKRLRPVAGELRVRAHMGVFAITKRQKTDKYESGEALKKYLCSGADRGFVSVKHRLGDESWAARMLEIIYNTEDLENPTISQFMAADSADVSIRTVKPKFTLVMFAKDLKIEVDITYEPKYRPHPETGGVRAFSHKRDKVAEVAVSCPKRYVPKRCPSWFSCLTNWKEVRLAFVG